jgi:hypothetical protein
MDELTRRRLAHNEALFRQINDEIEQHRASHPGALVEFLCECSDRGCTARIHLTPDEYRRVRSSPSQFVIADGHEEPEIEDVVEREGDHAIVQKRI